MRSLYDPVGLAASSLTHTSASSGPASATAARSASCRSPARAPGRSIARSLLEPRFRCGRTAQATARRPAAGRPIRHRRRGAGQVAGGPVPGGEPQQAEVAHALVDRLAVVAGDQRGRQVGLDQRRRPRQGRADPPAPHLGRASTPTPHRRARAPAGARRADRPAVQVAHEQPHRGLEQGRVAERPSDRRPASGRPRSAWSRTRRARRLALHGRISRPSGSGGACPPGRRYMSGGWPMSEKP